MRTNIIIFLLALIPTLSIASPPDQIKIDLILHIEVDVEEIALEDWMLEPSDWSADLEIPESAEADLALESWMIDTRDNSWNTHDPEEEIEMEDWMCDPSDWISSK